MRCLAPLLVVGFLLLANGLCAGETSIKDALEKARRRMGAPASDAKAKREKARRAAAKRRADEEELRKAREEAVRKAKEAKQAGAAKEETGQPATPPKAEKKTIRVFTLKDGTEISAVMVIELQDTYALKDKDGKLHEVKKDDIESIKESDKGSE